LTTLALATIVAAPAAAQSAADPPEQPVTAEDADPDASISLPEPDYTIISLPTALRLPRHGSAFRVTHRFLRPLDGDFGDLAGDLFGLDAGAQIGLEYRFGVVRNGQVGFHRTSDKTIQFLGQYGVLRQSPRRPVDATVLATIEGVDNFQDRYTPSLMAIVSRRFGDRLAVYAEPAWVHLARLEPVDSEADDVLVFGIGGRVRVWKTVSAAAEFSPRAGDEPIGTTHAAFAIEKQLGGHVFQLNVSTTQATTMGQIARGGATERDWSLGFNISRKFF
jgi:opacity protein-like surface antigen